MGVPIRLLIAEDSEDDCDLLIRELRRGGYEITFRRVDTAEDFEEALESGDWDLIVSDYSMPRFTGVDALAILRKKQADVPFIFVSGTIGEETAVLAMRNGAQDYLMKDHLARLVPAVQRELQDAAERKARKQLEVHVRQLQKFEAIGRLAGGVAHDFNNMIGAIMGWAELGRGDAELGSLSRERFEKIFVQSQRAAKLTAQLLAFGRRQILQRQRINLNVIVDEEMSFLSKVIGANIEIKISGGDNLSTTLADPSQIEQVLMNLCLNARDAMPDGGRLLIETRNVQIEDEYCRMHPEAHPGSYVLLSVADTGTGMDASTLEQVFEPFFTTKEMGRGTGLGLATVYGIVKQHGGFVQAFSEIGKGSCFRVYLQAAVGSHERRDSFFSGQALRGTGTVLIADDHTALRDSGAEMLQSLGYQTVPARDGQEALDLFQQDPQAIDLVILDVVMPRLNGPEAFARMEALRPGIKGVFTTGFTQGGAILLSHLENGSVLLQKPYDLASLSQAVRNLLAAG
ncbi:MAG TPA: response regulator [Candidatus Acidoferrum sp.]|nr:response regulator [Candidatus Acidoferrum sp.]